MRHGELQEENRCLRCISWHAHNMRLLSPTGRPPGNENEAGEAKEREPQPRIRRRRTGRPRELKNDVYTNTNCENDSSIRPTICRVLARPRMLPAFHLLPLTQLALPQDMTPARSGIGLTVRRKPLTKPQFQNFSRTQEVHPLWVREIVTF